LDRGTGLDLKTVDKALDVLIAKGIFERERGAGPHADKYTVLPLSPASPAEESAPRAQKGRLTNLKKRWKNSNASQIEPLEKIPSKPLENFQEQALENFQTQETDNYPVSQQTARPEQSSSKREPTIPQVFSVVSAKQKTDSEKGDDDKTRYASRLDRLTALMARDLGTQADAKLVHDVHDELQRKGCKLEAFCDDIGPRLKRLKSKPGGHPGFFLDQARQFSGDAPRPAPKPMLAAQKPADPFAWKASLCRTCGGGGQIDGDPPKFCADCPTGRDLERISKRAPPGKESEAGGPGGALARAAVGT